MIAELRTVLANIKRARADFNAFRLGFSPTSRTQMIDLLQGISVEFLNLVEEMGLNTGKTKTTTDDLQEAQQLQVGEVWRIATDMELLLNELNGMLKQKHERLGLDWAVMVANDARGHAQSDPNGVHDWSTVHDGSRTTHTCSICGAEHVYYVGRL